MAFDPVADFSRSPYAKVRPVPLSQVRLGSGFWGPRQRRMNEAGLDHGLKMLSDTGSIEAFDIIAGVVEAPIRGFVYRDSDLYKWLEAASYAIGAGRADLEPTVDEIIRKIGNAQDSGGYINTSYGSDRKHLRFTNLPKDHEIYCAGHLMQAAVAHHRATGKTTLLDIAKRFADHLLEVFGPEGRWGACGHAVAEMAMVELYRDTGNERYLTLAQRLLDARGRNTCGGTEYFQDHLPFREQRQAVGHAVRAMYLYAGALDIYLETGEQDLLDAVMAIREDFETKVYVTGGVGARHEGESFGDPYELPNARAYAETCAAISSIQWHWRLFAVAGDSAHLDMMELALYNGFLAGVSEDGLSYFYVNPLASDGRHQRKPWYDCACCPPNIYRTFASLNGLMFAQDGDCLLVNFYDDCELEGRLRIRTDYPASGNVSLEVLADSEIGLRIPSWCRRASVDDEQACPGAFHRVKRQTGDKISICFDMPIERIHAHPRIIENRESVALKRGPIVYCIEAATNAGITIEDAGILPNAPVDVCGENIDFAGAVCPVDVRQPTYSGEKPVCAPSAKKLRAIPYHRWGNGEPGPMKVWLPIIDL